MVNVVESYDPQAEKGMIISQSPEAGTTASAGSSITLRVSPGAGDNKGRVPGVVGMTGVGGNGSYTHLAVSAERASGVGGGVGYLR